MSEVPGNAASPVRLIYQIAKGLAADQREEYLRIVYRTRQTAPLDREGAIKVIKPGMDSYAVLRRLRTEQQALARMAHPHIASVYDCGETTRGHPYFVMEFVEGVPLDEYCHAHELSLTDRLSLMIELCSAC